MHTPERKHNYLIKSFNHNAANTQKPMSIKRDKRMIRTSVKQTTVSSGFRVADIQEAVGRSAGRRINLKTILNTRFDGVVPRELACAHEQAMPGNEHSECTMNHWERLCATRMKERKFHSFHGFWPWHGKIPWQPARMLPGNRRAYFKRQTERGMWCHPFGVIRCSSLVPDFSLLACHAIKPFFPRESDPTCSAFRSNNSKRNNSTPRLIRVRAKRLDVYWPLFLSFFFRTITSFNTSSNDCDVLQN